MSLGSVIAIRAIPFLELLDAEEHRLAEQVREVGAGAPEAAAMDSCRQRLAQGVNAFVRSLPTVVRNDVNTSRAAAYALVGLADERILHHPAGGLDRWREQLLEYELYGSALAGQEIVNQARAAAYATAAETDGAVGAAVLAPLYLAVFRAGFEGALRGDDTALATLTTSLVETVGSGRGGPIGFAAGGRPSRIGMAVRPLAAAGAAVWLGAGFLTWFFFSAEPLERASRIAERIAANLPVEIDREPLDRSAGPSGLPALEESTEPPGDR